MQQPSEKHIENSNHPEIADKNKLTGESPCEIEKKPDIKKRIVYYDSGDWMIGIHEEDIPDVPENSNDYNNNIKGSQEQPMDYLLDKLKRNIRSRGCENRFLKNAIQEWTTYSEENSLSFNDFLTRRQLNLVLISRFLKILSLM